MIDLHSHSNNSDGTHTAIELVDMAMAKGLSAIAITDHDTTLGITKTIWAGRLRDFKVVPGIEINAKYEGHNTHIVGLFIDPKSEALKAFSHDLVVNRQRRNIEMFEKLQKLGYQVDFDDFPDMVEGQVLTKGNIGKVLVEKGYFKSVSEGIDTLLNKGCPAYVPKKSCTPMEAVDVIHEAGGLAFVAHFYQIDKKDIDNAEAIARKILDYGADGLETEYTEYTDEIRRRAYKMAEDYGCLCSGGSDFHGEKVKPGIKLGTGRGNLNVPDDFLTKMEEKLKQKL